MGPGSARRETQCSNIDALVYVNLTTTRFLDPTSAPGDASGLEDQGWRSVSISVSTIRDGHVRRGQCT